MPQKKALQIPKPKKAITCIASDDPDETHRNYARAITAPEVAAFRIVSACEQPGLTAQLDTPAMIRMLKGQGEAVNRGEMTHAEQMLAAQATALQTLFARLTERAMTQSTMANMDGFMRLALRAQSQCRATLETLAAIKNPPVIYAKQANVTTGPQQVNNGTRASSRRSKIETEQSKLLEVTNGKRLDSRATGATICADSAMAAVGARHGAAD